MVYSFSIESRSPTNNTMYFIIFMEQKFSKIRAILAGDTCDEGFFWH